MNSNVQSVIPEYFINADESYSRDKEGNFLLNFFIVKNRKDFKFLQKIILEIQGRNKGKEVKSTNISDLDKRFLIKNISETEFINYVFMDNRNKYKNIEDVYFSGLVLFTENIENIIPENSKVHIFIDQIGGEKFQHKCLQLIRNKFKSNKNKCNANFYKSHAQETLQITDVLAGDYRKYLTGKHTNFEQFLAKNKNLLIE